MKAAYNSGIFVRGSWNSTGPGETAFLPQIAYSKTDNKALFSGTEIDS